MVMFTFPVLNLFLQDLFKKSVGILMLVTSLISQQFTRRDLKPVAFLVLPYKAVLHTVFSFFYFKPLATPLFIQLSCNNIFKFFSHPIFTQLTYSQIL